MDAMLNGPFGQVSLSTSGITIGRGPDNQLIINDTKASSHHARIDFTGQGYNLLELGSTNGTFVNEQRVEREVPRPLSNGDVIRIGDTVFSYTVSGAQAIDPTMRADPQPEDNAYRATLPASASGSSYPAYQQPQAVQNQQIHQAYPPMPSQYAEQPAFPVPSQPGYFPAGYGPAGAYPVAAPRRSLRWLWITLGIIGGVLVLGIALCAVLVFVVDASSPTKTLDTFCSDMKGGDYQGAYNEFSASYQSELPESAWTGTLAGHKVSTCDYTSLNVNGSTATANVTLDFADDAAANGVAEAVLGKESDGSWKITSLQTASGQAG